MENINSRQVEGNPDGENNPKVLNASRRKQLKISTVPYGYLYLNYQKMKKLFLKICIDVLTYIYYAYLFIQ